MVRMGRDCGRYGWSFFCSSHSINVSCRLFHATCGGSCCKRSVLLYQTVSTRASVLAKEMGYTLTLPLFWKANHHRHSPVYNSPILDEIHAKKKKRPQKYSKDVSRRTFFKDTPFTREYFNQLIAEHLEPGAELVHLVNETSRLAVIDGFLSDVEINELIRCGRRDSLSLSSLPSLL